MVNLKFSKLKKECSKCASELLVDQELLLAFLNSPIRDKIMKFSKLNKKEISSIMKIVDYYSKLKIQQEKKLKLKTKKDILKIEVNLLKKIFNAKILKFKKIKTEEAFNITKKILKKEYPNSVILSMLETDKIAALLGIKTIPSELLVFDSKNKKIIGVEVLVK